MFRDGLTLYGEKVLSAYPCVSFRLIENTGTKKGRYLSMARRSTPRQRTFSAARLSDILRGSYRLAPQSPASSHWLAERNGQEKPAMLCTSLFIVLDCPSVVKRNFSLFRIFLHPGRRVAKFEQFIYNILKKGGGSFPMSTIIEESTNPNSDRIEAVKSLFGILTPDITLEEAREERLNKIFER